MNAPPSVFGLNIVDLLMAFVIAAAVYIKRKDGIFAELFKTFGLLCMIFITLHYYTGFAVFLQEQFFGKDVNPELFAFSLLAVFFFSTFAFVSRGWVLILKLKSFEGLDRWANITLSIVRGYFICSLIYMALMLTGSEGITTQASRSLSGSLFKNGAVTVYRMAYSGIIRKLFKGERINEKAFKLIGEESGFSKS